ncbi:MAG: hypothetical protein C5B46_07685 [Proteobacteria bacterium]|nr:MAG: hypothetical protein C5B46_07685 [Pseudomonadota bacterium]
MPEKIGRYELSDELGKGAMGVVYKAVDPNIGRPIALKTMRVDLHGADMADMLRRFQNEARAAGALNHPNIVTIYDAGEDQGVFYIAMEYIPGQTLQQVLQQMHVLSAEQIVNIGSQICAGLDYAHIKSVVHRDIKPPNIMIAPDGTVKIMDFGIAKAGASLTHSGEVLGTPNYMSPEQVKGKELDGRTDLFSLGVILYEMATGERPFSGQNVTTVIYKIIHETPPAPRELDVTVHPGLSAIIAKCLSKDPEERYQCGSDLATALRSYKIVSIPPPRPSVVPPADMTRFATRPISTIPPTVRTPAPPSPAPPAATAAAAPKTAPANPPTQVINPRKPTPAPPLAAPSAKQTSPILIGAIIAALVIIAAGIGLSKRKAAAPEPAPTQVESTSPAPQDSPASQPVPTPPSPSGGVPSSSTPRPKPEAEKPATAAGVGELRVTSTPPGAQIEIDGLSQDYYLTPFNAPPMKSGSHSVRAQLTGMSPQTKQIDVVAGQKVVLDFQLTGDKAIYNISSSPQGAEILIDGVASGRTTPTQMMLTPGQHRVVLRLEGFIQSETTADAAAGQSINLTPVLHAKNSSFFIPQQQEGGPSLGGMGKMRRFYKEGEIPEGMGALQVRTRPKGVSISIDNIAIAKLSPFKFPLKPGSHQVTLQKDGFQSVTRTVQIELGQQLELEEILRPQR